MKPLAALLLLHYQLACALQNQNIVGPIRRSPPVMVSKPEEFLTDLSIRPSMPNKPAKPEPLQYPSIDMFLARGISKMTLDINKITSIVSPGSGQVDNIVYGPVTIAAAMALLLLGSLGQTFTELANFWGASTGLNIYNNAAMFQEDFGRFLTKLESTSGYDIGQTVNFATGIFIQRGYTIRPEFEQTSRLLYKTNILTMDFQGNPKIAQNTINSWVSDRTNKKIPSLLMDPPPPHTRAIIASVLYFKAPWEFPFFDGHTKPRPFYSNGRKNPSTKMAPMMVNGGEFPYYKDNTLGVEILGFPYKGGHTSMYVILPMDSNVEKLQHLENLITPADIERLVASTKITEVVVLFPKMRLENTLDLTDALQKLRVNALFNPRVANLGLITSGFVHKEPEAPFVTDLVNRVRPAFSQTPPQRDNVDDDTDRLVFTRFGDQNNNCEIRFDPISNKTVCVLVQQSSMTYTPMQSLERLRLVLNANPDNSRPDLYADQVIHKVFIDITESGTEAAVATGVSLNRSGGRVTFRVDMPFLFFIFHEESKMILFFGSVKSPKSSETS